MRPDRMLVGLLTLSCAACASGGGGGAEAEKVPPVTFAEVVAGETAQDVAVGDSLPDAVLQQIEADEQARFRPLTAQRGEVSLAVDFDTVRRCEVYVRGDVRAGDVELIEAVGEEYYVREDGVDVPAQLGLRPLELVGVYEGRYRVGRLSQMHRADDTFDVGLYTTERERVYLAFEAPRLDDRGLFYSVVHALDEQALARLKLATVAELRARVAEALAANSPFAHEEVLRRYGWLALDQAPVQAALAAIDAEHFRQKEAARQQAEAALAAAGYERWAAGGFEERFALYPALLQVYEGDAARVAWGYGVQEREAALRAELVAAADALAKNRYGPGAAMRYVCKQLVTHPSEVLRDRDRLAAAVAAAKRESQVLGVNEARPWLDTMRLWGEPVDSPERVALMQAAGRRRVEALKAGGSRFAWIVEEQALSYAPNPPPGLVTMGGTLGPIDRGDVGTAKLVAWLARWEASYRDADWTLKVVWQRVLRAVRAAAAPGLEAVAREAEERGLLATAACRYLETYAFLEAAVTGEQGVAAVASNQAAGLARTSPLEQARRCALPLVLAIDPALEPPRGGSAWRTTDRLREPPRSRRPLTRYLGLLRESAGDLAWAARVVGLPCAPAHLVREEGGGLTLVRAGERPREYLAEFDEWHGVSAETRAEGLRLKQESEWITAEKQAVEAAFAENQRERAALEAELERFKADQARGVPLETLRRRIDAAVAREKALNARIAANNARSSALSARIGPYNEAVVRNNTRRNREQFGPVNELRTQLDRALDAWFEARLSEHEQALSARAAEAGWTQEELQREVAWTRWLFGRGSSGPTLGSLQPSVPHRDAELAFWTREALRQPTAPEVARVALQAWAVTAELFPEEGAARAVQLSRRSAKLAPTVDAVVRQYGYEELERALGSLPADEQRALRDLIAAAREKL